MQRPSRQAIIAKQLQSTRQVQGFNHESVASKPNPTSPPEGAEALNLETPQNRTEEEQDFKS